MCQTTTSHAQVTWLPPRLHMISPQRWVTWSRSDNTKKEALSDSFNLSDLRDFPRVMRKMVFLPPGESRRSRAPSSQMCPPSQSWCSRRSRWGIWWRCGESPAPWSPVKDTDSRVSSIFPTPPTRPGLQHLVPPVLPDMSLHVLLPFLRVLQFVPPWQF